MFGSPLKPAGQAQGPTHRKNPQGIYASRKADDRSYRSNRSGINVVIGAPREHESAGRNQPQRYGNQTGLNGDTPARLLEAVPGAAENPLLIAVFAGKPALVVGDFLVQ